MEPMSVSPVSQTVGRLDNDRVAERRGPAWVVCLGMTRDVSQGLVDCPRRGPVSAVDCLTCHLVMTVADERASRRACAVTDEA